MPVVYLVIAILAGCARESPMFTLDVATLERMKPGDRQRIMFEESRGKLRTRAAGERAAR
jgi:hypothetical protein